MGAFGIHKVQVPNSGRAPSSLLTQSVIRGAEDPCGCGRAGGDLAVSGWSSAQPCPQRTRGKGRLAVMALRW